MAIKREGLRLITHWIKSVHTKEKELRMKYSLMVFAVMATLATGVMAQNAQQPAGGQRRQLTPEQLEQMQTRQLDRIKADNEDLHKELVALKEKDPEAFQKKLADINQNRMLERLKTTNEAQYKELMELKDKDPEAFQKKLAEVRQQQRPQGQGGNRNQN